MTDAKASEEGKRLESFRTLLNSCYAIFEQLNYDELLRFESNPKSQANIDHREQLSGPSGKWKSDYNQLDRATAWRLLYEQAALCRSLSLLAADPLVAWEAMALNTRAIAERSSRIVWLLDPRATHRERCIRAFIMDLASNQYLVNGRLIDRRDLDQAAEKAGSKRRVKELKKLATEMFTRSEFKDDPGKWHIEEERYPSWTDALVLWMDRNGQVAYDGEALYNMLAIASHPQGLTVRAGARWNPAAGQYQLPFIEVEKMLRLAITFFYSSLRQYANYHGVSDEHFTNWEGEIEETSLGSSRSSGPEHPVVAEGGHCLGHDDAAQDALVSDRAIQPVLEPVGTGMAEVVGDGANAVHVRNGFECRAAQADVNRARRGERLRWCWSGGAQHRDRLGSYCPL